MQPALQTVTIDDFGGGLNVVEAEQKLQTNFATELVNMHKDVDGSMSMRYGTKFKHDVSAAVNGNIVEIVDFKNHLIVFTDDGEAAKITSAGVVTAIWNETIANALSGSPSGWTADAPVIDYTEFKGELIVVNGQDKPIIIDDAVTVDYLQDVPTGSNVFTPIGCYITVVSNYVVIAGITNAEDEIYISAAGASGTWPGDAAPNDSTSINIAAYAPDAGSAIKGLSSFRNFLIVHFEKQSVILTLGTYDESGNHTPSINDNIPKYGILSHRCSVNLASDIVFMDRIGIHSGQRNVFGSAIEAKSLSDDILPDFAANVPFASADQLKSFALDNPLEKRMMFFMYNGGSWYIYTMSYKGELRSIGWSKFEDWSFDCGCVTIRNRVFFAKGSKVFQYGNSYYTGEEFEGDFIDEYDSAWATTTAYSVGDRVLESSKVYKCLVAHTSGTFATDLAAERWEEYKGDPIDFRWVLPWSAFGIRARKKKIAFVSSDTKGTGEFVLDIFVDNILKDEADADDPIATMSFVGGDTPGFGGGEQPFGGGRVASDERPYGLPAEFKLAKLAIRNSTNATRLVGRVKFEAMTIFYNTGNYHR